MITFPIKRGTARRLGIRSPKPLANYPQRWMLGMQEAVNNMHANMAAIADAYGTDASNWRPLSQLPSQREHHPGCPYLTGLFCACSP